MPIPYSIYVLFTAYCQSLMEMTYEKNSMTGKDGKESSLGAEPDNVEVIEIYQHNFHNCFWTYNSSKVCHRFTFINVLVLQCFHRRWLIYCVWSNSWSLSQEAMWQRQALLTTSAACTRQAVSSHLHCSMFLISCLSHLCSQQDVALTKVHYFLTEKVDIKQCKNQYGIKSFKSQYKQ